MLPAAGSERVRRPFGDSTSHGYLNHAASAGCQLDGAVAAGDTLAVRGTISGTRGGELFDIPPTGGRVTARQSHCPRVVDGKITERWATRDDPGAPIGLGTSELTGKFGASSPD